MSLDDQLILCDWVELDRWYCGLLLLSGCWVVGACELRKCSRASEPVVEIRKSSRTPDPFTLVDYFCISVQVKSEDKRHTVSHNCNVTLSTRHDYVALKPLIEVLTCKKSIECFNNGTLFKGQSTKGLSFPFPPSILPSYASNVMGCHALSKLSAIRTAWRGCSCLLSSVVGLPMSLETRELGCW